ncbi:hypothetical protein RND81_08G212700 [Saponaria officinalis]|uniref:Uncharacterized protein n=1 Tax=Saponaria officinalis TaxID=3572 RepID=A0AAW1JAV3_SAPOF
MDVQEFLHMNHGDGEFSYAHNSSAVPGHVFTETVKPAVENVIKYQLLHNFTKQHKVLKVADLGCGIGPTPVNFIATVIETMHKVCKEMMKKQQDDQVLELQIYMSDLPSTDFNMLFKDALKLQGQTRDGTPLCFVMGAPGSFYGRLFPAKSLHFVHSSAALHWLSQVPSGVRSEDGVELNKGSILASHTSTPYIQQTYFAQFKHDFTSFLTCRSQEVVTNAHMLLSFAGRKSKLSEHLLSTHLCQALARLVSKGVITEEKLDSFNMPAYFPYKEQVEDIIKEEGSFEIENMKVTIDVAASHLIKDTKLRAEAIGKFMRSILETVISYHFGAQIWDTLPTEHNQVILEHLNSDNNEYYNVHFTILLKKKLDY